MIYTLDAGDGGWAPDIDGMDAADKIWTSASNARFNNGYLQPFEGDAKIYDPPSVVPYGVFPVRTSSADLWAYMSLTKAYAVSNAGTHYNITRAAGDYTATADTKWTGGALTGFLIFNNANDVPQSWNGDTGTAAANLANWNSNWKCKAIRPLRNFLVALNITKTSTTYPVMVKWSHAADPGTLPSSWDEADATKFAGEQDIGDADGVLVDLVPLSDLGVIYSTNSYHAMQYIGGTYVWRFTKLSGQAGALSQNCVVRYPGGHLVLTQGDVVIHNGGEPTSIVESRIKRNLFNSLDTTNYARSFVVHNHGRSEVWICIPESGQSSCTKAYVWNYAQNSWGVRDLTTATCGNDGPLAVSQAATWADLTGTWDTFTWTWDRGTIDPSKRRLVLGSVGTKLYVVDSATSYDGSNPPMYVERTGLSLGRPDRVKLIKAIYPRVDAAQGMTLNVRIGGSLTADGPYTWTASTPYTVGTSLAVYGLVSGRYIGVKLESTAGSQWRCRSLDIEYEITGEK